MQLIVKRLDRDLPMPEHAHPGDAGVDLRSTERVELAPGERRLVPTGLAVAIPVGWAGLVVPRSGLAIRHGIGVVNGPGLIDAGYRGEIKVIKSDNLFDDILTDIGAAIGCGIGLAATRDGAIAIGIGGKEAGAGPQGIKGNL